MIKKTVVMLAAGLILSAHMAVALTPNEAIAELQAAGYSRIEVKVGPTQMKVEAIRGTEKVELVYNRATGTLLKRGVETLRPGENTASGVFVRERGRDFVRVRASGSASDDTRADDDGMRRGRGADDAPGDDNGGRRGRGADDAPGDDNGGDRGGRGRHGADDSDDRDDDRGGRGRGRGGDDDGDSSDD
jgi:hypothetical protein